MYNIRTRPCVVRTRMFDLGVYGADPFIYIFFLLQMRFSSLLYYTYTFYSYDIALYEYTPATGKSFTKTTWNGKRVQNMPRAHAHIIRI
jgi:hypothetical protein